jgi:hypothetical protein
MQLLDGLLISMVFRERILPHQVALNWSIDLGYNETHS